VIIAIVALISGSVGVMNAMLLTIQERKMEIGMYKFYGSGIRELQYDVFFKTLAICLGSGLFGMLLGLTAGGYIGSYFNIGTKITYMAVSITTGASAVIGIASSLYPAVKISRVDASEAIWGE
jgi:putative ABC transport system permease protein